MRLVVLILDWIHASVSTLILGGLEPNLVRLGLDALAVTGLACILTTKSALVRAWGWWVSVGLTLLTTNSPTARWTLTFPLIPFTILQVTRHSTVAPSDRVCRVLSGVCVFCAAALCCLFPAVELPAPPGPFAVGVADFYLPLEQQAVPVRLFYPTDRTTMGVPYPRYKETHFEEFCRQTMKFGAPDPLKDFDWMLHTWAWTKLQAQPFAPLLQNHTTAWPVVVYSHGLSGSAEVYTFQTLALASRGAIVLVLTHLDGSAPVVQHDNGTIQTIDMDVVKLWRAGQVHEYEERRRQQTEQRVSEVVAATEGLYQLIQHPETVIKHQDSIMMDHHKDWLRRMSSEWKDQLQPQPVLVGHSFGGATVLSASFRRPDLFRGVLAKDPAVTWMPGDVQGSLFLKDAAGAKWKQLADNASIPENTYGVLNGDTYTGGASHSIYDKPVLVVFSQEWRDLKWARSDILQAYSRLLPQDNSILQYAMIEKAHHNEFSDSSLLTPLWLARAVNITGPRNPLETAMETHQHAWAFVESLVSG